MSVVVVTPPVGDILDLAVVKAHLRVDHDDDDALIEAYVAATVEHLGAPDGWLGRSIVRQTLEVTLDGFPVDRCGDLRLPWGPVHSIETITYLDAAGVEQTLAPEGYRLGVANQVRPAFGLAWPATRCGELGAVTIRYVAGHEALPAPVRAAVLLMIGDLYSNRETVVVGAVTGQLRMSVTVETLLAPYRMWC